MHADGTGERIMHVWIRLQSEGAARQFGVLSFSYASANETPHISLVRVHKPDGSSIDTPVAYDPEGFLKAHNVWERACDVEDLEQGKAWQMERNLKKRF